MWTTVVVSLRDLSADVQSVSFLEYIPRGLIASCLRKHGGFDEEAMKLFAGQVLSDLEYLHYKGFLHRVYTVMVAL